MEACRIVIAETKPGVVDVGAPMKHKDLCYDILDDAKRVIELTHDQHFDAKPNVLTIVMGMSGLVDVAAPLPPREKCYAWLKQARGIIERFDDAQAPVERAFNRVLMGEESAHFVSHS
jgi:hypothetical protein